MKSEYTIKPTRGLFEFHIFKKKHLFLGLWYWSRLRGSCSFDQAERYLEEIKRCEEKYEG